MPSNSIRQSDFEAYPEKENRRRNPFVFPGKVEKRLFERASRAHGRQTRRFAKKDRTRPRPDSTETTGRSVVEMALTILGNRPNRGGGPEPTRRWRKRNNRRLLLRHRVPEDAEWMVQDRESEWLPRLSPDSQEFLREMIPRWAFRAEPIPGRDSGDRYSANRRRHARLFDPRPRRFRWNHSPLPKRWLRFQFGFSGWIPQKSGIHYHRR